MSPTRIIEVEVMLRPDEACGNSRVTEHSDSSPYRVRQFRVGLGAHPFQLHAVCWGCSTGRNKYDSCLHGAWPCNIAGHLLTEASI